MLLKLINAAGNSFLLDARYIYEVGPTNEDSEGNSIIFTTIVDNNKHQTNYTVMDSVDEIYALILKREKAQK